MAWARCAYLVEDGNGSVGLVWWRTCILLEVFCFLDRIALKFQIYIGLLDSHLCCSPSLGGDIWKGSICYPDASICFSLSAFVPLQSRRSISRWLLHN